MTSYSSIDTDFLAPTFHCRFYLEVVNFLCLEAVAAASTKVVLGLLKSWVVFKWYSICGHLA